MYQKFIRLILVVHAFFINAAISSNINFGSKIFFFEDSIAATGLHVRLEGDTWYAEDVKSSHLSFQQSIFTNTEVMSKFADGQIRTPESVAQRVQNSIDDRFAKGHPHGILTVVDKKDNSKYLMHVVAGGGDRPGTSEIAYAMPPEYQGKKLGTQIVNAIVEQWAPEVRRIGLGKDVDNENITKAFQCFGGKVLDNLDATASPSNPASWKILEKVKFGAAQYKLNSTSPIDWDSQEISLNDLEPRLLKLYDPSQNQNRILKVGERYSLHFDENVYTFSKHERWDRMKFHFEKPVS